MHAILQLIFTNELIEWTVKEFGVWCVVGSPVWKPREVSGETGVGGSGTILPTAAPSAPTTLPRSQRPAPRASHLSASRKSLAPDHRH
ncbi:unnamed protein product [Leptidea sinapis]|uniref:Uncharacterized protein n=1 Tax=Leptidea sinapis TaxID=189913 RepID=A0A5E4QQ92_9NEOP|nr:unnamed protein product [Leptidea sinapis]